MKTSYPFLRDPRALLEIRKHQWLESEKIGQEIGFGSAAVDWINKYGELWRKAHVDSQRNNDIFLENRKFRRFRLYGRATVIYDKDNFPAQTVNVSYFGLLCRIERYLEPGSIVIIQWSFLEDGRSGLVFGAMVERASSSPDRSGNYEMLLKFDEGTRGKIHNLDYLRG